MKGNMFVRAVFKVADNSQIDAMRVLYIINRTNTRSVFFMRFSAIRIYG